MYRAHLTGSNKWLRWPEKSFLHHWWLNGKSPLLEERGVRELCKIKAQCGEKWGQTMQGVFGHIKYLGFYFTKLLYRRCDLIRFLFEEKKLFWLWSKDWKRTTDSKGESVRKWLQYSRREYSTTRAEAVEKKEGHIGKALGGKINLPSGRSCIENKREGNVKINSFVF